MKEGTFQNMDENTRLILELSRTSEIESEDEPMMYDLRSLLERERKRILTPEGERLIREAKETRQSEERKD